MRVMCAVPSASYVVEFGCVAVDCARVNELVKENMATNDSDFIRTFSPELVTKSVRNLYHQPFALASVEVAPLLACDFSEVTDLSVEDGCICAKENIDMGNRQTANETLKSFITTPKNFTCGRINAL